MVEVHLCGEEGRGGRGEEGEGVEGPGGERKGGGGGVGRGASAAYTGVQKGQVTTKPSSAYNTLVSHLPTSRGSAHLSPAIGFVHQDVPN